MPAAAAKGSGAWVKIDSVASSGSFTPAGQPAGCCLVRFALNNACLKEQGVPGLRLPCRESGIVEAKPDRRADEAGNDLDPAALRSRAEVEIEDEASHPTSLIGTARCGAARRVAWEGWQAQSCHLDPIPICLFGRSHIDGFVNRRLWRK